jgi:hypothetical protein
LQGVVKFGPNPVAQVRFSVKVAGFLVGYHPRLCV